MPVNGRAKGAAAEREFISLMRDYCGDVIGADVKRNLEQVRNGGHDILGLGGWAVEVKRYKSAGDADIRDWWDQAERQGREANKIPVLAYRLDRREWRVRIPLAYLTQPELVPMFLESGHLTSEWTAELSIEGFAMIYSESLDVQAC